MNKVSDSKLLSMEDWSAVATIAAKTEDDSTEYFHVLSIDLVRVARSQPNLLAGDFIHCCVTMV